ncbi:MAG: mevalonate kinase [Pleurocapsa minor GSE-CHR-MK-17-07R]|jgi:mevalonate kinase|nr:mevalonate kinase [Pleurocapsa minor GSE-CHR-MK 17-07R]
MTTATACAKCILLGEHAVVYDRPALAVPVSSLRVTATLESNNTPVLELVADDLGETILVTPDILARSAQALVVIVRETLHALGQPLFGGRLVISSKIPIASGLGSGAAISTAIVRVITTHLGLTLSTDHINQLVYKTETLYHGTPSGIDNTVIAFEKPVYFKRGMPLELLSIHNPFTLLIADTGVAASTRVSVGHVRELHDANPALSETRMDAVAALVERARTAIESGESSALGTAMDENHALLQQLEVSSPELDRLVTAARSAGALGAKLSGGGMGGNMIALVTPEQASSVAAALRQAGAVRVIETTVSGS